MNTIPTPFKKKIDQDINVVVLDIKMPGMDGHETLKEIKKRKPDIPVIMLTGHGDEPSARDALVQGAFDYLGKPCDIDILTEKIREACHSCILSDKTAPLQEPSVADVMIPISDYTTIEETKTIHDALVSLKKSFSSKIATSSLMETGHRSILVVDGNRQVTGILTIRDMLEMLLPGYLFAPKPSLADTIEYSPMFWNGLFALGTKQMKGLRIGEVMSPTPKSIEGSANLMEAAHRMLHTNERRLLVTIGEKTAGVIREQDLFFQMEKIMNR
ncbi:MAG: response regulator [Desulfamplus sp.]|nr:response regulator [Desulfamplus sp.]